MKVLCFQAKHFRWTPFSRTLETVPDLPRETTEVQEAVVAFVHAEVKDEDPDERRRVFKHLLKHIKWLANKREMRQVVLHSFTHLGAENSSADFARDLLDELAERLRGTGYEVGLTPFGWFCEWELSVHGESLAKVWKEI